MFTFPSLFLIRNITSKNQSILANLIKKKIEQFSVNLVSLMAAEKKMKEGRSFDKGSRKAADALIKIKKRRKKTPPVIMESH